MDIYLIRHGKSTGNAPGRIMGWSDHPLTDHGRAQAAAVAERLAPLGPMPVVASDLLRARHTADAIAGRWGVTVETDPRWRETHCGDYEDCTWETFNDDPHLTKQLCCSPLDAVVPGGESIRQMAARVLDAYHELIRRPDDRICVVTHGGPLQAILMHCLGMPDERFWVLEISHASLSVVSVTPEWTSVRLVNDVGHWEVKNAK